jgi:flagellar assembly protein FliH
LEDSAAEVAARDAQLRAQAWQEGAAEARKSFDDQLARERASVAAALAEFHRERADYFRRVEAEVVQLALSIARKVLHREAQIDPQLLAGIVRVALEKIEGATEIKLRLHPRQVAEWRQYLTMHMQQDNLPELIEDPAQAPESCVLQTSLGTAVVGVEVQLKEIEQGLADLLAARPGAAS